MIGRHRCIEIEDGPVFYIDSSASIAKEAFVACGKYDLSGRCGVVKLITQSSYVSARKCVRDLQLMINLLQPKYLFPARGVS